MRISDWSSDVCSSDLGVHSHQQCLETVDADRGLRGALLGALCVLLRIAEPVRLHAAPRERGQQCRCEHRGADATEQGNERGHAGGRFFCLSIRATPVAPALNSVASARLDLIHCGIAGSQSAGSMMYAAGIAARKAVVMAQRIDHRRSHWLELSIRFMVSALAIFSTLAGPAPAERKRTRLNYRH